MRFSPVNGSALSLCLVAIFLSLVGVRGATNLISGTVTTNTTWSGTNLLTGTVTIQSNVVVTINPGTRMLMNTAAVLRVEGQLLADGMSNAPITFTRSTTTTNWGRIFFVRAASSRLRHCVIEFAQSVGDHQNYYTNTIACDPTSPPIPRIYHEAIVALATHLDIENCIFQNLPYATGAKDGDAIAIIADDVQYQGAASAHVWNCRFTSIGQGVHSRYSPLLVEYCTFSDKRGDNDDVDMYGESTPPPVIRYNTFLAGHEDKINPTRCSAIIYGNFIAGGDDHGVVLRDKCNPIVFNNIFSNFTAAAISVQNQCDALIANNTIINSGRGIRMFDHTARHGEPYCLFPGNGKATVINCIIWNTPIGSVTMEASAFLPHPVVTVINCDIQGGQSSIVTNNANCVINWGSGNINVDPQFTNGVRLRASSPCIDAGTNALLLMSSNWTASITNDYEQVPRPLDGNGTSGAAYDIGAYEYLLSTADSNGDGIPDGWTWQYRLNPTDPNTATNNPDGDPRTTFQEWVADTNPTNALSYFRIAAISNLAPVTVRFSSSSNRQYTLSYATNLVGQGPGTIWTDVPGQVDLPGNGSTRTLTDSNPPSPQSIYRVRVKVP
jgi:hypothetical protein